MMPYQFLITSTGSFQLPETFEDACHLAYDHCSECSSIRVLRLDPDTLTFEDCTDRVAFFVAQNLLDLRDEEHGFPEWAQEAFDALEPVLEGDY